MKKIDYLIVVALLLFTACAQPAPKGAKPDWIFQSSMDGKIGAVGVSGRTYNQVLSAQRKIAMTRALDELSMQLGVKVALNMTKVETVHNDKAALNMKESSSYKANNLVTAHVQEMWMDRSSGELYVWMVLDK